MSMQRERFAYIHARVDVLGSVIYKSVNVDAHEILSFTLNRAREEQKWHVKSIYIYYIISLYMI